MQKLIECTIRVNDEYNANYTCVFDTNKHNYDFQAMDDYLASICYCDGYEFVKSKDVNKNAIDKFTNAINAIKEKTIINDYFTTQALLYTNGYYETIEEMLKDNKEMF